MKTSPAFGQADLTNCERELIHLTGSVQPHGVLLAVREPSFEVVQASANVVELLRRQSGELLERPLRWREKTASTASRSTAPTAI